jgi:DTW domain-containing protein YfiP
VRHLTEKGQPGRCQRCWVVEQWCVCGSVLAVPTRTEVVVIRHVRESAKSTGTARIAALAMPNLRILDFGDDAEPARRELAEASSEGAALLFPTDDATPWDGTAVKRLYVLDGTWRQTRRMYAKLPALHGLKKRSLPEKAERVLRLRASRFEAGRSTLEAIAEAIGLLEGEATASPLHTLHATYVEKVFRARGVWEQKKSEAEAAVGP